MFPISAYFKAISFCPDHVEKAVHDILDPQFYKKDPLCKPGRICPYIWYLEDGLVGIREDVGDKEIYHWLLEAPAIIIEPHSSLDGIKPAKMYIEPIVPCTTQRATMKDVNRVKREHPEFGVLSDIINAEYRRIQNQRETDLRTLDAKQRFRKLAKENPSLFKRTPDKIMMSYIKISPGIYYECKRKYL